MPRLLTSIRTGRLALRSPPAGSLAITLTLVAVAALRRRLRHVVVAGGSMSPTLQPGDRLITLRTAAPPRIGRLALVPDPRVPERLLIKRVHAIDGGRVDLRGDAAFASTDSRTFGTVPLPAVEGCVTVRYYPPDRVGRVS